MPKKGKLSTRCGHSAPDEVSRKALRDSIKTLRDKHFAPWKPSLGEEAVFEMAEGLEKAAKSLRIWRHLGRLRLRLGRLRRSKVVIPHKLQIQLGSVPFAFSDPGAIYRAA